jgi:hypothetical protein
MKRQSMWWMGMAACAVVILGMLSGCARNNGVNGPMSSAPVNMAISFSQAGTPGLMKTSGGMSVDSLRIDSAVVVLARIKFESHIDSVIVDTADNHTEDLDMDANIVFKGPFVIHVRDTVGINFANEVLPAGTYTGIKLEIHRLMRGEPFEDSDDHRTHSMPNDTTFSGSSITVWGAVLKNGAWVNFKYQLDASIEFKIKGTFTVPASTSNVNLALNINMGTWFTDPMTGALLDPTDASSMNAMLIRRAILSSFEHGRGGHDRGDGHPDND